ncbi:extensin [Methylobacterium sp. Leaf456]|uniref:extensin-like domain-containing protein n=1 Tax=Methylobacterium sp. Leaf456 TaxID=1736382 RepID=UPI0006F28B88|nr:extensin family protein [Methylobacterium sp. Leaf456]KQT56919.1 extensin [Methylobacterium sp. Leaf456]
MRPVVFACLLAAVFFASSAGAEPAKPPAATVPLPPPEPPARPADLVPQGPPTVPQTTPLPPERPPELTIAKEPEKMTAGEAVKDALPEAPLPPARPPELSGEAALALKVAAPDDSACLRRLERLGARFEAVPPLGNGQCSAPRPLSVTALADGIALEPAATLTCRTAEALARWTTEVQASARRELDDSLKSLSLGGTYVCRGQNHDTDAKLSEHSFANAVDVMGYGFSKRPAIKVTAAAEGTPEAAFLAAVRASACTFFRTVLGPGSDAAHGNHLHLDERERNAGHRLCQ